MRWSVSAGRSRSKSWRVEGIAFTVSLLGGRAATLCPHFPFWLTSGRRKETARSFLDATAKFSVILVVTIYVRSNYGPKWSVPAGRILNPRD